VARGFYRQVVQQLTLLGFVRVKGGKGSHEKWVSAVGDKTVTVPRHLKSRHTANNILKSAGSSQRL